jgi:hypothetical protein
MKELEEKVKVLAEKSADEQHEIDFFESQFVDVSNNVC